MVNNFIWRAKRRTKSTSDNSCKANSGSNVTTHRDFKSFSGIFVSPFLVEDMACGGDNEAIWRDENLKWSWMQRNRTRHSVIPEDVRKRDESSDGDEDSMEDSSRERGREPCPAPEKA